MNESTSPWIDVLDRLNAASRRWRWRAWLLFQPRARDQIASSVRELVYGPGADKVRERTQLHKLLETQAWIFGPQFHLATSDKGFRTVIARHRALAGLPDAPDDALATISGIAQVPDLFLAAQKDFRPMMDRFSVVCWWS